MRSSRWRRVRLPRFWGRGRCGWWCSAGSWERCSPDWGCGWRSSRGGDRVAGKSSRTRMRLMSGTPAAEVNIDESLIRALLREQHPDLAHLPCVPVDAGWDNVIVRLGDSLCLRLPRRAVAAALIEHEQAWLPGLSKALPLPIPVPLRVGLPGCGYPWRWSIVPWLTGDAADRAPPAASEATRLGEFLKALHTPALAAAPSNPVRGVPLQQ